MGTSRLVEPVSGAQKREEARHLALGREGEALAAEHLTNLGFVVLSRNWRCREGELDLVATDGHTLVVCEVKTRSGLGFGDPAESVTEKKAAQIRRLTTRWLSTYRVGWCPIRFDVMSVLLPACQSPQLRHIPGAF